MTDEKPRAEAAPPATITLYCGEPGCGRPFQWLPRSGRRPKYGPCHKRGENVERSELGYYDRKQLAAEMKREERSARDASKVSRLAAGLRISTDLETAAKFAGVEERGAELEALGALARKEFERLITGDMRDTAHLAEATAHLLMLELRARMPGMSARDIAAAIPQALEVRNTFIGDGATANYTAINLTFLPPPPRGPDGKQHLTPEQLAKVRGSQVDVSIPKPPIDEDDDADRGR